MTARRPTIVATSIGYWPAGHGEMDWRLGPAYRLAASLARAGDSPRVCLVGTAIGDSGDTLLSMYAAFGRAGWRVSHLALFPEPNVADIQEHLLAQDVVWVAGGSAVRTRSGFSAIAVLRTESGLNDGEAGGHEHTTAVSR